MNLFSDDQAAALTKLATTVVVQQAKKKPSMVRRAVRGAAMVGAGAMAYKHRGAIKGYAQKMYDNTSRGQAAMSAKFTKKPKTSGYIS